MGSVHAAPGPGRAAGDGTIRNRERKDGNTRSAPEERRGMGRERRSAPEERSAE
jgi:hypothetical protein